jgi:hypothetical protein
MAAAMAVNRRHRRSYAGNIRARISTPEFCGLGWFADEGKFAPQIIRLNLAAAFRMFLPA